MQNFQDLTQEQQDAAIAAFEAATGQSLPFSIPTLPNASAFNISSGDFVTQEQLLDNCTRRSIKLPKKCSCLYDRRTMNCSGHYALQCTLMMKVIIFIFYIVFWY